MPNIKSAKKRVLVTKAKTIKNKIYKSALKTNLKKIKVDLDAEKLKTAYSLIDKAVAKGVLHKNNAARKKSKLAAAVK